MARGPESSLCVREDVVAQRHKLAIHEAIGSVWYVDAEALIDSAV